jgi:hypothetical protein
MRAYLAADPEGRLSVFSAAWAELKQRVGIRAARKRMTNRD